MNWFKTWLQVMGGIFLLMFCAFQYVTTNELGFAILGTFAAFITAADVINLKQLGRTDGQTN